MENLIINIKPKIVRTFSDSDDEIQIGEVYMDDSKKLILNLKLNESIQK